MKKVLLRLISIAIMAISLTSGMMFVNLGKGKAQSIQTWSDPFNLSGSGSSTTPSIVIDREGLIHVIWIDEFDGYKYAQSTDGVAWSSPITVNFPFKPKQDSVPTFVVTQDGLINIFWRDSNNALFYSQTQPSSFGNPANWFGIQRLASSALDFNVVADSNGMLHLGYVAGLSGDKSPAGIYYRYRNTSGWSPARNLYVSQYFRSTLPEDAHVRISTSEQDGVNSIFAVWDDRQQKRIYMASSSDDGLTWGEPTQIKGPEDSFGVEFPFNIEVAASENNVLLIWQLGLPGSRCVQYSQSSVDRGNSFDEPRRMLDEFSLCPQRIEVTVLNKDIALVSLYTQNDLSLIAWDWSNWSTPQIQSDLSAFVNPVTYDSIILGCQKLVYYKDNLFIAGCDEGGGGDIWFSARPLGSLNDWFPPPTAWTSPVVVASTNEELSELSLIADGQNRVHAFWIQSPLLDGNEDKPEIYYSQWNGVRWLKPVAVITGLNGKPTQLTVKIDKLGRILLAWVDEKTGELLFRWAGSDRAGSASEWVEPIYVPVVSQSNSAPDILTDDSGMILITYANPINDERGIYFVTSVDAGKSWSQPSQIFDAKSNGWEMVDQPKMCLDVDGRLHVIFGKYSYQGDQRLSLGLYYSQSLNGGVTWSEPAVISEQPVFSSTIFCDTNQVIHRFWQEDNNSNLATFHQISRDGGVTWEKSINLYYEADKGVLTKSTLDPSGGLHLLHLTDSNNLVVIDHLVWNGSQWLPQDSKELRINTFGIPSSLGAVVSTDGKLFVSVAIDYANRFTETESEILNVARSLDLRENVQELNPVFIPTIATTSNQGGEIPETFLTPTQSPLENLSDPASTLSRRRNITGILLVGGVLILTLILIRPRPKRND